VSCTLEVYLLCSLCSGKKRPHLFSIITGDSWSIFILFVLLVQNLICKVESCVEMNICFQNNSHFVNYGIHNMKRLSSDRQGLTTIKNKKNGTHYKIVK